MKHTHPRLSQKPELFDAREAHDNGIVRYDADGTVHLTLSTGEICNIPSAHQFDLTQGTIFGLNERITSAATSPKMDDTGKTLRDLFNQEWELYEKAMESAEGNSMPYGIYAYYRERNDLVRYCPEFWHRTVAVASSGTLLNNPQKSLSWSAIRNIFENTVIGVAGGSVGNNVLHSIALDLRPRKVKIADKSNYKLENINRVRLGYDEMSTSNLERKNIKEFLAKNKARITAEQIYRIDPFIDIFVYEDGITEENAEQFLRGDGNEPPIDILLEEVDDPSVKVLLRELARKYRIPLIMVSDMGSAVQLDVLRYDLDSETPLTFGTPDNVLHASLDTILQSPRPTEELFFNFVDKLIGTEYRTGELESILLNKSEIPTSTLIPQLGSTAAMAGAIAAETVARIRLGHSYPQRVFINKHTFRVTIYP